MALKENASLKYKFNSQPTQVSSQSFPFQIIEGSGEASPSQLFYALSPGVIFSKYSYGTGSFIPIDKMPLNGSQSLDFIYDTNTKDQKIFIELNVTSNLQISGGLLKCEPIGKDAPDGGWTTYPDTVKIEPGFDFWPDGRLKNYKDGARQTKAYILVGYTQEDRFKNGGTVPSNMSSSSSSPPPGSSSSSSSIKTPDWVQILNTDVIMMTSIVSGIPCTIPFPYFLGSTHMKASNQIYEE